MKPFTFKIGGEAGFGITSAGLTFSKIVSRSGYHAFDYMEYPSIVRGGHNVMQTTIADRRVATPFTTTDFLVALNQETMDRHAQELGKGSILLYDKDENISLKAVSKECRTVGIPLTTIAREAGGNIVMRNTVALAATLNLLGGELSVLKKIISEEFKKKPEILKKNLTVANAGFRHAAVYFKAYQQSVLGKRQATQQKIVVNGNEAIALGAVAAGMQFAAIYPMTPTSNILHVLAKLQ